MVRLSSLVFIVAACLAATTTSGHQIEPALRELAAESPAENRSLWWWSKPQWMKDLDKAISTAVSKAKDVGKHAIAKGKALIGKRRLGTEDEAANNERHLIDEDEGEAHRRLGFWSWFKKAKADVGNAFKHAGKKISDARQSVFKNITVRRDRHGYGRHLEEAANNERHLIDGEDEGEAHRRLWFWSWFNKAKADVGNAFKNAGKKVSNAFKHAGKKISEAKSKVLVTKTGGPITRRPYRRGTRGRGGRRGLQEEEEEAANDFWSWFTKTKAQSEANKEYHLQTTIRPSRGGGRGLQEEEDEAANYELQEEEDEAANDFWSWFTKTKAQSEANKQYHLQTTIRPTNKEHHLQTSTRPTP